MTARPPRPSAGEDRRSRDRRIRELADHKVSSTAIGERFGISRQRVEEILARTRRPQEVLAELRAEKAILVDATGRQRERLVVLNRQIARIEDQLETERIDRLLGLT